MKTAVWVKRGVLGTGVVAGLVVLTGFGPFRHGHHRMDAEKIQKMADRRADDVLDDLDATDDQRARIKPLVAATVKDGAALHDGNKATRQLFLAEWQKENPDAAALHTAVDGRLDDVRVFAHTVVDRVLAVHAVLTPKQRSVVAEEVKDRMGEH
jgi:protein CpxP